METTPNTNTPLPATGQAYLPLQSKPLSLSGEELKHEGQKAVANGNPAFFERALGVIKGLVATRAHITFDVVRQACEKAGIKPGHCNCWGVLPSKAVKAGLIRVCDSQNPINPVTSLIKSARARKLPVWLCCQPA